MKYNKTDLQEKKDALVFNQLLSPKNYVLIQLYCFLNVLREHIISSIKHLATSKVPKMRQAGQRRQNYRKSRRLH